MYGLLILHCLVLCTFIDVFLLFRSISNNILLTAALANVLHYFAVLVYLYTVLEYI